MKSGFRINRTKILRTVSVVCLLALICGVWSFMGNLIKDKTSSGTTQIYSFYQLESNTVDVLVLGSSHAFCGVNPFVLFDEHGIASYDMTSGGQPVWISYYYLKEALKTQKPQLVLCDIFTIYRSEKETEAAALRGLINLKPSLNKWEAIKASNYNERFNSAGIFLNFPYTHTRYKELTETDFLNYGGKNYLGYVPQWGVNAKVAQLDGEIFDAASVTEGQPLIPRAEEHLRKLCALCKEEGIPLLLINTPYLSLTEEKQKAYNYAVAVAKEYGVPFLDGNKYVEEIGIIWTEDAYDTSHLNYQGSLKYTKWLSEYLHGNYDLEDRSNDPQYQHWTDESTKLYHEAVLGNTLGQIDEADAYLRELQQNEQLVVAVTLAGKWEKSEETISELMRSLTPDWNGENALLVDEDTVIFSADSTAADYCKHFDYGRVVFEFSQKAGKATVRSNKNQNGYEGVKHGINVVVYDKVSEEVIDIAYFEIGKEGLARKH